MPWVVVVAIAFVPGVIFSFVLPIIGGLMLGVVALVTSLPQAMNLVQGSDRSHQWRLLPSLRG